MARPLHSLRRGERTAMIRSMPIEQNAQFQFWGCSEIRESLGLRADTARHLLERLETVSEDSIYYHTVRCILRRRVYPAAYPDDFSGWIAGELLDVTLAERLAFHSPFD